MSLEKYEIASAGGVGLNDRVFDVGFYEQRSWELCNSRIPQPEVVYLTQIFLIMFLMGYL